MTNTDLKLQLQELIGNSVALQSLPAEAQEIRSKAMLSADDATMKQFITVLSSEAKQLEKIDADTASQTEEISNLIEEAKQLEKEAKKEIRKEAEVSERTESESKAEDLLKELDKISDN
jgi:hypothetical protein